MQFTISLYPDKVHYVDSILNKTEELVGKFVARTGQNKLQGAGAERVVELLAAPVKTLKLEILDMKHYTALMCYLDYQTRKQVALRMTDTFVQGEIAISSVDHVISLFDICKSLIEDEPDMVPVSDEAQFAEEQRCVCKLVYQIGNISVDDQFKILTQMRTIFGKGGNRRLAYTLQPVFHQGLKMIEKIDSERNQGGAPALTYKKVFGFIHKTNSCLVDGQAAPDLAFQNWLIAALAANRVPDSGQICKEFLEQAMTNYDELKAESQFKALQHVVGTLVQISTIDDSDMDAFNTKVIKTANTTFFKKNQKSRAIAVASRLFWSPHRSDGNRVNECLTRCLKILNDAITNEPQLVTSVVDMLEDFIYYVEAGAVENTKVGALIQLSKEHINFAQESGKTKEAEAAKSHLEAYIKYIQNAKKDRDNPEVAARLGPIDV